MATPVGAFPAQSECARPSTAPAHGRRVRFKEPLVEDPPASPCSTSSQSSAHSSFQCSPVTPLPSRHPAPGAGSALSRGKPGHPSPTALPLIKTPLPTDQLGHRSSPPGRPSPRASTSSSHRPTSGLHAQRGVPAFRQLAGQAGGHPSSRFMVGPGEGHSASAQERGHPPALGANPASHLKPAMAHDPNLAPFIPGPSTGSQTEASPPSLLRPNLPHANLTQQQPRLEGATAWAKAQPNVLPQHTVVALLRPPALIKDPKPASAATHATPAAHSKHSVSEMRQVAQAAAAFATGCWSNDVSPTPTLTAHPAPSSTPARRPVTGTPLSPLPVSAARPRPAAPSPGTSASDSATAAALQQMQNKVRRMEWELGRMRAGETRATVVAKWGRLAFGAARAVREQVQGQLEGAQRQVQTLEERERELQSSLQFLALEGQDHRDLLLKLETQLAASADEAAEWRQREAQLQAKLDAVRRDLAQVREGGAVGGAGADALLSGLQAEERGLEEGTKEASEGARASELSQAVLTDLRDELARQLQCAEEENRALRERNTRLEELVQKLDLGSGPPKIPCPSLGGTDALHKTATWDAGSSTSPQGEDRGRGPLASEGELLGQLSKMLAMLMESEQKRLALFMRHRVGDAMRVELQMKLQEAERRIQFLEAQSDPSGRGAVEAWRVSEELQREKETTEYLKEMLIDLRAQERMHAKRVEDLETLVTGWSEKPKNGDMDVDSRSSQGDMEELYELANIS